MTFLSLISGESRGDCLISRLEVGYSRIGALFDRFCGLYSRFESIIGRLGANFSRFAYYLPVNWLRHYWVVSPVGHA